ncbi:MAG: TolC family protein, partial [bacterium]
MSRAVLVTFALVFGTLAAPARAAEPLTLSQALDAALRANARLQVARNDRAVAGHENSLGNAGFLPALDATAARSAERGRTTTTPSSGAGTTADDDADATTLGLRLSWTLFDGGRMFSAKSRLASAEDEAVERLRSVVEATVGSTLAAYFDVVRLQRGVQVLDDAIAVTDERARLAQARFETGAASKLDGLQARVDLDARRSDRARLQVTLEEAMGRLNLLMGVDSFRTFEATDSIRFDYAPDLTADVATMRDRNTDVRLARAGWRTDRSRVAEV